MEATKCWCRSWWSRWYWHTERTFRNSVTAFERWFQKALLLILVPLTALVPVTRCLAMETAIVSALASTIQPSTSILAFYCLVSIVSQTTGKTEQSLIAPNNTKNRNSLQPGPVNFISHPWSIFAVHWALVSPGDGEHEMANVHWTKFNATETTTNKTRATQLILLLNNVILLNVALACESTTNTDCRGCSCLWKYC